ncbi:piggyBac transposable element-derived protein 4-like [Zophobas morio]|uniref:piggyBac transposable element-derived protein 4-like n=1 Tax=Zophobas morio TaxID=2755281 RepID=UPI003082C8D3
MPGPSNIFRGKRTTKEIESKYQDITSESEEDIEREQVKDSSAVFMTQNTRNANAGSTHFGDDNIAHEEWIETENDADQTLYDLTQSVWGPPVGNHLQFEENFESGIKQEWQAALMGHHPIDYYFAFVDFDIIDAIVDQTNIYATQFVMCNNNISNKSRVHNWEPTTRAEIIHLIGLLSYMGMVRMNSLRDYWSQKWLLKSDVARNVMSRNRFEILLKMLHFSDNEQCPEGDRLYKIQPLIDMLTKNYQTVYTPGKTFCIDETMVPFQGRLVFKQYNPQKTHKYGIKVFKLCCNNGYTWNISIYAGKEKTTDNPLAVSTQIVLKLAKDLLGSGRLCITDNWYTSLQLAHILLDHKTHCLGTLRANRKGNPPEVIKKKLKKGEVFSQENERGICLVKWRDKRDVLVLSTGHTDQMVEIQRRGKSIQKPTAIVHYNSGKSSIDLSDQMASYSSALRKSIRWYKKLAIEVLLGTSMVNAHIIYKDIEQSNIPINDFRLLVTEDLLKFEDKRDVAQTRQPRHQILKTHQFTRLDCKARENRRSCKGCYQKKVDGIIEKNKVKKVTTYCQQCDGNPRYCLECFNLYHNK